MTFQASRHERNNYSCISNWIYPRLFFFERTLHQTKHSPTKKSHQTKKLHQTKKHHQPKKLSPNPLYPISSESKTKTTRFPTFHPPPSLASTTCWGYGARTKARMLIIEGQGPKQWKKRKAAPQKGYGSRHSFWFIFCWNGKKRKSLKISARMLISIWMEKSISFKKRRNVEVVGLFLWVNFGRVFPPNDGGIYMATWVWNAKYLFWVEEWEQLYFKKNNRNHVFWFLLLRCAYFLLIVVGSCAGC